MDVDGTEAGQGDRGYGALVEMLTDQVVYLRSQLDQERQAHAEARRIIGGLVQRVPELEAPAQERAPEPREAPESPAPTRTPTAILPAARRQPPSARSGVASLAANDGRRGSKGARNGKAVL